MIREAELAKGESTWRDKSRKDLFKVAEGQIPVILTETEQPFDYSANMDIQKQYLTSNDSIHVFFVLPILTDSRTRGISASCKPLMPMRASQRAQECRCRAGILPAEALDLAHDWCDPHKGERNARYND